MQVSCLHIFLQWQSKNCYCFNKKCSSIYVIALFDCHLLQSLQNSDNEKISITWKIANDAKRKTLLRTIKKIRFWKDGIMKFSEIWQNREEQNGKYIIHTLPGKNHGISTLRVCSLRVFYLAVNKLIIDKMQNIFFFNRWIFWLHKIYSLNKLH